LTGQIEKMGHFLQPVASATGQSVMMFSKVNRLLKVILRPFAKTDRGNKSNHLTGWRPGKLETEFLKKYHFPTTAVSVNNNDYRLPEPGVSYIDLPLTNF